ncbi:MAG: type VI secretion system-associated protein TagF [Paracoccaceae bacterium]
MVAGFGAFGKIPSLGDFFRLDLPHGFVEPWDNWLQAAIVSARDKLGEAWNARYLSAPIWRFSLPPGQAGPQAVSGVLMASVDRVGRQFPLTLAAPHDEEDVAAVHFCNIPAFETLETVALQALDDSMTRDALQSRLESVALRPPGSITTVLHPGGSSWQSDGPMVPVLAAQKIAVRPRSCGVWSTSLEGDHRIMLCDGLPNAGQVAGLFDLDAAIWMAPTTEVAK